MEKKLDPATLDQLVKAVQARLGHSDPQAARLIAQEVAAAMAAPSPQNVNFAGSALSGLPPKTAMPVEMAGGAPEPTQTGERIVVSANGRNKSGIVARLTAVILDFAGDVRDISQTLVGDYFTMMIVVDIAGATRRGAHFSELKERLQQAGAEMGVHVVALHDDLLTSMHSV